MIKRIEFIGVPGSGKTTIRKEVYKDLKKIDQLEIGLYQDLYNKSFKNFIKSKNNKCLKRFKYTIKKFFLNEYNNYNIYGRIISDYLTENNYIFNELLNNAIKYVPNERKRYVILYLLNDIYRWNLIQEFSSREQYVMMDEGFTHRIMNILMFYKGNKSKEILLDFLSSVTFPDVLIYIKYDIGKSIRRMENRKEGIPKGYNFYNINELTNLFEIMESTIQLIIDCLKENGVQIIEVENEDIYHSKTLVVNNLNF